MTGSSARHTVPQVRPHPDHELATTDALRWQALLCRDAHAPIAAAICDAVADDMDGPQRLVANLPTSVRAGDQIGLRIMAVVHRLAGNGQAPDVAIHLPTCGGSTSITALDQAWARSVVDALVAHPDVLHDGLTRVPQTNEPSRSRALRAVLSRITLPVRLIEVGASAGLNLRADHLPGDPLLEAGPLPAIVERVGYDLHPIDPSTAEGRQLLHSFVWVDHVDRASALDSALAVAQTVPGEVVTADAGDAVESIALRQGTATVVWHSLVWGYLPAETRARITRALATAGSTATSDALLVHAAWEPVGDVDDHSGLTVTVWDGSHPQPEPVLAATGDHHGTNIGLTGTWPEALDGITP